MLLSNGLPITVFTILIFALFTSTNVFVSAQLPPLGTVLFTWNGTQWDGSEANT
jgi:hypothetical protein